MTETLILTMKWGTKYGPEYVNNLARGVRRHLQRGHRFVCFTDDATGLEPGIEALPLPPFDLPAGHGDTRWRKLSLFSKDLFGLSGTALFLDLDLVVVGDLEVFFEAEGGVPMVRDDDLFRAKPLRKVNTERDAFLHSVGNSSVFRYEIGAHAYILENYLADPAAATAHYEISQQFQTAQLAAAGQLAYWDKGLCVSFKNHCVPRGWRSFVADPVLPENARLVLFAGTLGIDDALARKSDKWYRRIGNVDWLEAAWRG
ncbi:MAG: hypothetical protein AAF576_05385 [Pseudomonadota bacterium]